MSRKRSCFQTRFDQRDTERAKATLEAADEVVWSCFGPVLQNARDRGVKIPPYPAPLVCLESEALPSALPPTVVADELRSWLRNTDRDPRWTELLAETLRTLPIPIVRLPAAAAHSPWLVVLLAHEVGHHIAFALRPKWALVREFKAGLRAAVAVVDPGQQKDWEGWANEVFADVFSVLAVGPMAARALADAIAAPPDKMAAGTTDYPPPAARLGVMKQIAKVRNLSLPELPGLTAAAPSPAVDPKVLEAVATYSLSPLPGIEHTLEDLLDFDSRDFSEAHEVERIAQVTAADPRPTREPKTARLLAAAAYTAWLQNSAGFTGPTLDDLAKRICPAIVASTTDEVRSVGPPAADVSDAAALAGKLLAGLFVPSTET